MYVFFRPHFLLLLLFACLSSLFVIVLLRCIALHSIFIALLTTNQTPNRYRKKDTLRINKGTKWARGGSLGLVYITVLSMSLCVTVGRFSMCSTVYILVRFCVCISLLFNFITRSTTTITIHLFFKCFKCTFHYCIALHCIALNCTQLTRDMCTRSEKQLQRTTLIVQCSADSVVSNNDRVVITNNTIILYRPMTLTLTLTFYLVQSDWLVDTDACIDDRTTEHTSRFSIYYYDDSTRQARNQCKHVETPQTLAL